MTSAIAGALERNGLRPVTFFAQNDGTLMDLEFAIRFPVLTIGSGPANSIRGAAYLTGRTDAIVVDVGGTSTDVGVLVRGFPRESSFGVEIGGIRTNFRMPDLVTIALGGGTIVTEDALGPESVGYRILEEALAFGGSTPTLTDAGVAAQRFALGDASRLAQHGPLLAAAIARSDAMLADAIDRVKTSREPVTLVAVGGGAPLVPEDLPGTSEVLRPDHSDVANAIGAAIALGERRGRPRLPSRRRRPRGRHRRGVVRGDRARGLGRGRPRERRGRRDRGGAPGIPHRSCCTYKGQSRRAARLGLTPDAPDAPNREGRP